MTDIALLQDARSQLLGDLVRVPEHAAAFEPVPGARTIAESLLHVAAVEFVFAAALLVRQGRDDGLDAGCWERLKLGLATEIGYDPPQGIGVRACIEALDTVREMTLAALASEPAATSASEADLRAGLEALRARGADLGGGRAEALLPKLASHLGAGSLGVVLVAHEEYHRGQVLYQNFLSTRMPSAAPQRAPAAAVIGAHGYVGAAVAEAVGRGVTPLVRRPDGPHEVAFDFWHDDVRAVLDGSAGAVVLAARLRSPAGADDREAMRTLAARARALARGCEGRLIVLVSSDAVFRGDRGGYAEHETPGPVTDHGRRLRLVEEQVMAEAQRWCIVRPSYVFGHGPRGLDRRLTAARLAVAHRTPFDVYADMIRSPIAVGDLASAIAELAAGGCTGIIHAGGPAVDVATFYETGLAALGEPTGALRRVPAPAGVQRDTSLVVRRLLEETSIVPRDVASALRTDARAVAERTR